jgi:hypothetical protein
MNIIGHPYVAHKVVGRLTADLVLGSWIPDIVPFVPGTTFEFGEIHEGGERLLHFLDEHYPERRDIALGMLCHGVEFGADGFSGRIEKRFEDEREELAQRIAAASGVSLEVASKHRFHNFLWWGVEVQILRHRRDFTDKLIRQMPPLIRRSIPAAADLLAECFGKSPTAVRRDIAALLEPVTVPIRLLSTRGLAEIWREMAVGLPERDQIDVEATERLFQDCAELVEKSWEEIVGKVVGKVKINLGGLS